MNNFILIVYACSKFDESGEIKSTAEPKNQNNWSSQIDLIHYVINLVINFLNTNVHFFISASQIINFSHAQRKPFCDRLHTRFLTGL